MDDTNELTQADLAFLEAERTDKVADTPEAVAEETEKQREEAKKPETKAEPVKEEAKAPTEIEVIEDDKIDDPDVDGRKYVKVGVARKEREAKKELKARLESTERARLELEARLKALEQPPRQLQPEEVPQVALERVQNLERTLAEQNAKQQFVATYAQKAQEFAKEHEDFPQAYQHAIAQRRMMYEVAGYAPHQVNALLESEEAAIVERALIDGANPAEKIYEIATKVYGYKPAIKTADPAETNNAAREAMAAEVQQKTADKTLEAAKKLEKIAKGMDKNKSLSGGGAANEDPGLEELAAMSDAEFEKATAGAKFRELMGG